MARDTNFYYSFLVLPAEKRDAIIAVWDFCRAVDDAVDEAPADQIEQQLALWRQEVAACFGGGTPQTPQGQAVVGLVPAFNLPRAPFDALIEGVAMDIGAPRYQTFDDLYEYCIRVASAVGLICVEIFGYADARARQYATDLGVALQLTNILRDVAGDLHRGRLYIPLDDMRTFGCSEEDLRREIEHAGRGVQSPNVKSLLRHQAERAHDYYRRAAEALPRRDARSLVAAEIMGAIYFAILAKIERSGYDVFSGVVRIPRPKRALIALRTWMKALVGSRT